MSVIPKSLIEKFISEELVRAKVDELFGAEYSITLEVHRDGNEHEVTMTVKNKNGEEILPSSFDDNDVLDPIHVTAFIAEACGVMIENGRITHNKAAIAVQLALLESHADEIKEAIKNEKENSNED